VVCDENAIGGDGSYCGGNDAKLGRINAFYHEASYHEASGVKYVPCAVLFDLEPNAIDPGRASSLGNRSAGAGNKWAKGHNTEAGQEIC
jgi:hypothetical protein